MATKEITVPNIGGASNVEVIEILVNSGDKINKEDSLITLESDKASMDIPSPYEGTIEKLQVKVGDRVSEGSVIVTMTTTDTKKSAAPTEKSETITKTKAPQQTTQSSQSSTAQSLEKITVPDIGGAKNVKVIEILVQPDTDVQPEQPLITLEDEKAAMDIPSPCGGKITAIHVKIGDRVSMGDEILTLATKAFDTLAQPKTAKTTETNKSQPIITTQSSPTKQTETGQQPTDTGQQNVAIHAGPAVRRLARELGVSLAKVTGTGPKQRILKEDLQNYVKSVLSTPVTTTDSWLPKTVPIDFTQFGDIETVPLHKIKKLTGVNVHRNWITIPHVTQFDEADITELEKFRKSQKAQIEKQGYKLTPLVFIMKAVVAALKKFPNFNSSLDAQGDNLIVKKYYNLGIAVETPKGLVVPVIKNVDQKGMLQLAQELADISHKAREKGLTATDMSGSCFTISSLGGIGGTAFTPIINAPDVAILGVSKSTIKSIFESNQFVPRLMLPLSLSYDHRVIDGAEGARFLVYLATCLADIRTLLL